jgi:tetratricopeptide (TPR) repeat protein
MTCSTVLHDLVQKYLSLYQYDTAKFFAERLYYENPSPENLNVLAQCFYRLGKLKQAYHILQDSDHPSNRYLFALVCIAIGKLTEAERALSPNPQIDPQHLTGKQLGEVPEGAAGLYLLGRIARRSQCRDSAMFFLKKAIEVSTSTLLCLHLFPLVFLYFL